MTLHLLKLCVGIGTLSDLAAWQTKCLKDRVRLKQKPELIQDTRNMPKRRAELLDGGSLYWVIKGWIVCGKACSTCVSSHARALRNADWF